MLNTAYKKQKLVILTDWQPRCCHIVLLFQMGSIWLNILVPSQLNAFRRSFEWDYISVFAQLDFGSRQHVVFSLLPPHLLLSPPCVQMGGGHTLRCAFLATHKAWISRRPTSWSLHGERKVKGNPGQMPKPPWKCAGSKLFIYTPLNDVICVSQLERD